mgnify:CR=1 FL=1
MRQRQDISLLSKRAAIEAWEAQNRTGKKRLCRERGVSINHPAP